MVRRLLSKGTTPDGAMLNLNLEVSKRRRLT